MFEQHPVPQQISSYQFRLVGDMTLKQFFQLAAGAVIGLIIYSLPLPGFFKWPLIAIVVLSGAAFAFLPIQDRPLEQWLAAFFRSIYAPTLFVWKKAGDPDQYFATDNQAPIDPTAIEAPQNLPQDAATRNLDAKEKDFLSRISSMVGGKSPKTQTDAVATSGGTTFQPIAEPEQAAPVATQKTQTQKSQEPATPTSNPVEVSAKGFAASAPVTPISTSSVPAVLNQNQNTQTQSANFSTEAAPPSPPSQPNTVVGQVMDLNGRIVEGAILEITDTDGRPVRALKTNKAGHFMIVTPLPNGKYKVAIEKEGLNFEPLSFETTGEVVAPIAIRSKDALPEPAGPYRAVWSV